MGIQQGLAENMERYGNAFTFAFLQNAENCFWMHMVFLAFQHFRRVKFALHVTMRGDFNKNLCGL